MLPIRHLSRPLGSICHCDGMALKLEGVSGQMLALILPNKAVLQLWANKSRCLRAAPDSSHLSCFHFTVGHPLVCLSPSASQKSLFTSAPSTFREPRGMFYYCRRQSKAIKDARDSNSGLLHFSEPEFRGLPTRNLHFLFLCRHKSGGS